MKLLLLAIGTLTAACTLSSNHSGDDVSTGGGGGGGSGAVLGRQFVIRRFETSTGQCPSFSESTFSHGVEIRATTTVLVDSVFATNVTVTNTPADENIGDPPNVMFTADEDWSSVGARPRISYTLWVNATDASGNATTTFSFPDSPTGNCSFQWDVMGS